jgi:hypothetical protein
VPKLIVLFFGSDSSIVRAAEAAAAGATSVRFTEVDLRSARSSDTRHKRLDSADVLPSYHGIVFVAGPQDSSGTEPGSVGGPSDALQLDDALRTVARAPNASDLVLGLVGGSREDLIRLAQVGAVVIGSGDSPVDVESVATQAGLDRAHAMGSRVAKVMGWVRHGLGHEAAHHHAKV